MLIPIDLHMIRPLVWSEEESFEEEDEDEVLTPKVFSPGGGPMFLMPEIRDNFQEQQAPSTSGSGSTAAVEENGILLQVPGCSAPRRRHSWICG